MEVRFIADNNVGKLARWLRVMGYDTLLCEGKDDRQMIKIARSENRVILTKDTQFMKRRLVTDGTLRAIHIRRDVPTLQVQEVVTTLNLDYHFKPFSLCLECNQALMSREKEEVRNRVPARIFGTHTQYTECPACRRIYWQGTHWQAMVKKLQSFQTERGENGASS